MVQEGVLIRYSSVHHHAPPSTMSQQLRRQGDTTFARVEKVSSELFSLTYGAVVTQLIKDYEDVDATSVQLEKMCAPASCVHVHIQVMTNAVSRAVIAVAGGTILAYVSLMSSLPRHR